MRTFGISECKGHYLVRLYYVDKMPQIQKVFCWGNYRNKTEAFSLAVEFRDKEIKKLQAKGHIAIGRRSLSKPQENNKSGILGVHRIENRNHQNKPLGTYMWSTTFIGHEGKAVTKCFSEAKYGAKEAFKMACYERADGMDLDVEKVFMIENVKIPDWI